MPAARPTQWSKRLQPHNKYRHFIVGGWINAGRGQERRFSKEVQPQSLHGLRVTGKIIINNTENLLGAYCAVNFTTRCAMKHSDKHSHHTKCQTTFTFVTVTIIPSNIFTGRTQLTIKPHDRSLYNHIRHSSQRYRQ